MDSAEFDSLAKSKIETHPSWFDGSREEPARDAEIEEFERHFSCQLPNEYKYFAKTYGFGDFAFVNILSIRGGEWSIKEQMQFIEGSPAPFIPVSDNGCGDYYGFLMHESKCSNEIYFFDHESSYSPSKSPYKCLFSFIAKVGLRA